MPLTALAVAAQEQAQVPEQVMVVLGQVMAADRVLRDCGIK